MKNEGRAYVHTIGCQMNVYDSEKLALILRQSGYATTQHLDSADVVVCNTCAIRHKAEEKAFSFLGRFAKIKKKSPHLILVMAGCVAQQEGKNAFKRAPYLDIVLGTQAFSRFEDHLKAVRSGQRKILDIEDSRTIFEKLPDDNPVQRTAADISQAARLEDEVSGRQENKISRFVTIMQGCENFCTYCVVPHVRGRERSRHPDHIIKEIAYLAGTGVKEVTLLGQNVNSYGRKEDGISFADLLTMVNDVKGIERIRFATSHPKDLSDDLIAAIRDLDKVCNHIHLPVQSGSNTVLKKMNRGYTREVYIRRIQDLRKACPDIGVSTDMIVGFPSESRKDFDNTLDLMRTIQFDSIFAFAYSNRSSAPASKFSEQVEEKEKMDRLNELLSVQETYTKEKHAALVGKTLRVLVEGRSAKTHNGFKNQAGDKIQMTGRSACNKIIHFPSIKAQMGDMVDVRIENAYPHSLWGYPLGEKSI